jgi:uncharacterized protein YxeA
MKRFIIIGVLIVIVIIGSKFVPKNVSFGANTFGSSLITGTVKK